MIASCSHELIAAFCFVDERNQATANTIAFIGRAEFYRRAAEQCLEQAALALDDPMKVRMRFLANEWLKLAAAVALVGA